MKRSLLAVALFGALAATGSAAMLVQGMHEFRLDLATDFDGNKNNQDAPAIGGTYPVYGGVGYFPWDNVEIGVNVSFRKSDWNSYSGVGDVWGIGVFGEYDVPVSAPIVPFATARIGVLDGNKSNDTALNAAAGGGVRFFITELFSISAMVEIDWASKDMFNFKREGSKPTDEVDDLDVVGSGDHAEGIARIGARYIF